MNNFFDQIAKSYDKLLAKLSSWIDIVILQLPNLAIAIIVGVLSYFLSKYLKKASVKAAKRLTDNKTLHNLVANLTTVIFGIIILFIILSIFNLSGTINKLLATAGVLGLAVGLALQDPMNNLFSGVFMSVRKLYKIGDLVESNGHFGIITDIDLRATKLRIPTGQDVVIPNKDVIQQPLINYSSSGVRRVDVSCGISYGEDLERVERIVRETISSMPDILSTRPVDVIFTEFDSSSINFVARFWMVASSNKDYLVEKSKGIKKIKEAFDKNDILIPFPIRTLDFGIKGGLSLQEQLNMVPNFGSSPKDMEMSHNMSS